MFDGKKIESKPWMTLHVQGHLSDLNAERALASLVGLAGDPGYMADLEQEIAATHHAFVGAAVTEIATLRAELSGRQVG